jgi:hypothetical protein
LTSHLTSCFVGLVQGIIDTPEIFRLRVDSLVSMESPSSSIVAFLWTEQRRQGQAPQQRHLRPVHRPLHVFRIVIKLRFDTIHNSRLIREITHGLVRDATWLSLARYITRPALTQPNGCIHPTHTHAVISPPDSVA